jgi:hypothetical protein
MTTQRLTEAEQFFYDHAGWSWDPKVETPEQGRIRCAHDLAAAEERLKAGPYMTIVEPESDPMLDKDNDLPQWCVLLYEMGEYPGDDTIIGSLGCIDCETDDDPYIRVVSAELALEHIDAEA